MSYAAAIFDLDGTLIDSLRDIGEAMNRSLAALGFPTHHLDKYNYFVGDGVRQLIERALPADQLSETLITTVLASYRLDYGQHWHNHTAPYPGIPALLQALIDRQIPIGVLSNKPDAVTHKCVEFFFPDVPFIAVAGQKEDVPRKPDPAAAFAIAEGMNLPPERCVFVGDTATDMQTAVAAGMFPAGVTWGFRPRSELIETGARLLADRPEALLGLFRNDVPGE